VDLVFIGIPVAYNAVGGYDAIKATLDLSIYQWQMWLGTKY
jgi:hypothetical protein